MANKFGLGGTLESSFQIGRDGPSIITGTSAPGSGDGNDGDLFIIVDGGSSAFYQKAGGSWQPFAASSISLGSLTDVTITSANAGDVLTFDGAEWVNLPQGTSGASALSDLTDVSLSAPVANNFLSYNGTVWVNLGGAAGRTSLGLGTANTATFNAVVTHGISNGGAGAVTLYSDIGTNDLTLGGTASTIVIPGDLQVDGTTTTINTTNLDVADKNITVNHGGNTATAAGAGINIEGNSSAIVGYFRAASDNSNIEFKAPTGSALTLDVNTATTLQLNTGTAGHLIRHNGTNFVNAFAALDDLSDVVILTPTTDQLLKYDGTNWTNQTVTIGTGDLTGPGSSADNAVVVFDGTTGKNVKNSSATVDISGNGTFNTISVSDVASTQDNLGLTIGTSIQAHSDDLDTIAGLSQIANSVIQSNGTAWSASTIGLDFLDDVILTSVNSGDVLFNNGTDWINAAPGSTSGVQAHNNNLDDISVLSQALNNVIVSDGTSWTSSSLSIDNLNDVIISGPITGQMISFNGTDWINSDIRTGELFVDDVFGDDATGNGSITRPFGSIQAAIDSVLGTGGITIRINSGEYIEDLNINKQGVFLEAHGPSDSQIVVVRGHVNVAAGITRFRGRDIKFTGLVDGSSTVTFTDTDGRHYFDNCGFEHAEAGPQTVISWAGTNQRWNDLTGCGIWGNVDIGGTPTSNAQIRFRQTDGDTMVPNITHDNWTVRIIESVRIGQIIHSNGELIIDRIVSSTPTGGDSIVSTADATGKNKLLISNVNLRSPAGVIGKINKTGACDWLIQNSIRDVANDTLTGSRVSLGEQAIDIAANYSGTSYIQNDGSVTEHLIAIDSALGSFVGLPTGTSGQIIYNNGTNWIPELPGAASGVQPYDDDLSTIAGLAHADNSFIVSDGTAWTIESGNTARTSLGLGTTDNVIFNSIQISAGANRLHQHILTNITNDDTVTELLLDGISSQYILPANTTAAFSIKVVGRRTDATGESAIFTFDGAVDRDTLASSIDIIGSVVSDFNKRAGAATWDSTVDVDTSTGALRIQVTGENGKDIRWTAFLTITETSN